MSNEQIRIAVVGCCHGELDEIYRCLRHDEHHSGQKVDLLLICGDFQAVRNYEDLNQMAVPQKFRKLNTFYKYYSGEEMAPVLTIFIGGNHEASGFLQELPYGGWVAPNIYYLGYSGVIQFGGLRIAGLSGIFKPHDFNRGHYERPPYTEETKRSCYHVRALDVYKMHHIKEEMDIFLSHDWPLGVYHFGNVNGLLRAKPYFHDEIMSNTLGNPYTRDLLHALRPRHWFAAHLHCHFRARIPHGPMQQNGAPERFTEFSALNKVLPGRRFLEIFSLPSKSESRELRYDPEWLAILRKTDRFTSLQSNYVHLPREQPTGPSEQEKNEVLDIFQGDLNIPANFSHTSPPMERNDQNQSERAGNLDGDHHRNHARKTIYINPQTERLSQLLGIVHPFKAFASALSETSGPVLEKQPDPNEINLEDDDDGGDDIGTVVEKVPDPDEIDIDDDEGEDDESTLEKKSDPNEINLDGDDSEGDVQKSVDRECPEGESLTTAGTCDLDDNEGSCVIDKDRGSGAALATDLDEIDLEKVGNESGIHVEPSDVRTGESESVGINSKRAKLDDAIQS